MFAPWSRAPALDWIQIEISTRCNADCIYCPRHVWRDRWQSRLLAEDLYYKALKGVRTPLVHLQGWGEPLTHPSLAEMARAAHTATRFVGTTTNGMLLTRERIEELVDSGLDLLAFSFAGVDEANDAIRRGTRIATIRRAIDDLHAVKARRGIRTPHVNIAYMLLRSRMGDIEALPRFFGELGAEQAIVSSLSLVVDPALAREAVLARDEQELDELRSRLGAVRDEAARSGCDVYCHVVVPFGRVEQCSENVTRSAVVASGGEVGPCVIGQVPAAGDGEILSYGRRHPLPRHSFGHLAEASLPEIWSEHEYVSHRKVLDRGAIPAGCRGCYKLRIQDLSEPSDPA